VSEKSTIIKQSLDRLRATTESNSINIVPRSLQTVQRVSTRELHGDGDSGFPAGPTGNPWVWG